jgi:hypothetical protein
MNHSVAIYSFMTYIETYSNVTVLLQDSFEEEASCQRIYKRKLTTPGKYSCFV